jgi:tripartite-type tricarboxylate transporter receptor subunit TctC
MVKRRDGGSAMTTLPRRALLALPALLPTLAQAQPAWPEKPLRLVVPYPGGSTPDLAARSVAGHYAQVLGQPCVVDNRAGGNGTIGTEAIARATDGHTIGASIAGPATIAKALNPNLSYDPATDLLPISQLVRQPMVLSVHPSVPVRTVAEFVAYAKANPGKLAYASVGAGTAGHLMVAELAARQGLDLLHVPFRSVPQGVTEVVAGRVQVMAAVTGAVLPQVREGSVRALAITSEARFAQAPEIPTLTEQGFGEAFWTWVGLFAPQGFPAARVERLAAEAGRALATPEASRALVTAGFEVVGSSPAAFAALVRGEIARWAPLIQRLGIKADS